MPRGMPADNFNNLQAVSAYDSIRLDDMRERQAVRGEALTQAELRLLARLEAEERRESENAPRPHWYGGDYPDAF